MKFNEYKEKVFKENQEVKEEYDKMKKNEIIDFERKGNVVRFYLGENGKQWGDDWDDAPYDLNAEAVYLEFVSEVKDVAFQFDDLVLEPCCGKMNCGYTKQDMIKRYVPCIIVVPKELWETVSWKEDDFSYWVGNDKVKKYYFGDTVEDLPYVHSN